MAKARTYAQAKGREPESGTSRSSRVEFGSGRGRKQKRTRIATLRDDRRELVGPPVAGAGSAAKKRRNPKTARERLQMVARKRNRKAAKRRNRRK